MQPSNHSSRPAYSRVYWLTHPGQRLAAYLDYVDLHPTVNPDIHFVDIPEQMDEDRPETDLERLNRELEEALQDLRNAATSMDNDRFYACRQRVSALRSEIYRREKGGQ